MKNTQTQRPEWSAQMEEELAQEVGRWVYTWSKGRETLHECKEAARDVISGSIYLDGFQLAKEFEEKGFVPDLELVELLSDTSWEKRKIHAEHIKQWVIENNITLQYKEGQKVIVKMNEGEKECEITMLRPELYEYGVWFEGLSGEKGEIHRIIKAEEVIREVI